MNFSIFEFHNYTSLEEFRETLRSNSRIPRTVREWQNDTLLSEVRAAAGFDLYEHETLQIEGQTIQYLFFDVYTERKKNQDQWYESDGVTLKEREERINPYHSNMLTFQLEDKVYAIVFSGINRAKSFLRDIFIGEVWGNVDPVPFSISEDLLYWIFKRYIDTPRESLSQNNQVFVTALESYMGKTRDNVNAMRGEGSRISTILGTLAFLFNNENENLKAIRPAIQYGNEKVLVELGLTGTFKTWSKSYRGQLFRTLNGQKKENAIAIFIFAKIIPLLIECYEENIRHNRWSPQLKIDFIKRLGTMIREEVDSVLVRLEQENIHLNNDDIDILDEEDFDLEIDDEEEGI
jgi:hypothetical protein